MRKSRFRITGLMVLEGIAIGVGFYREKGRQIGRASEWRVRVSNDVLYYQCFSQLIVYGY